MLDLLIQKCRGRNYLSKDFSEVNGANHPYLTVSGFASERASSAHPLNGAFIPIMSVDPYNKLERFYHHF